MVLWFPEYNNRATVEATYENPIRTANENISINVQQICFAQKKLGGENSQTKTKGAESV